MNFIKAPEVQIITNAMDVCQSISTGFSQKGQVLDKQVPQMTDAFLLGDNLLQLSKVIASFFEEHPTAILSSNHHSHENQHYQPYFP